MRQNQLVVTVSAAFFLFACPQEKTSKPAATPTKAPTSASKPATPDTPVAAAATRADPACMAAWNPGGAPVTSEAGDFKMTTTGTKLEAKTAAPDGKLVLGVVADIKENTAQNVSNLKSILGFFSNESAEAIVVVGDLGETQPQIEEVLDVLAGAGVPVFAVIGNREGKTAFNAALAAAAARNPGIVNMNNIRLATLDDVALISMPGYYNKVYIHSKDGCDYGPADVAETAKIAATAAGKTTFIVSHGPPRQSGTEAIDRTLEQANVGDPDLAKMIASSGIKFGLFANIHESGGRATDLAGTSLVKEGTLNDSFYLNPGPADAVRWQMNDGTESVGMAAIVSIEGKQAQFKIHRIGK